MTFKKAQDDFRLAIHAELVEKRAEVMALRRERDALLSALTAGIDRGFGSAEYVAAVDEWRAEFGGDE